MVLFGFLFFILDKLFYLFLLIAPKLEVDKRLELMLNGKINKEIIVMGSSRGVYNIIAGQIERETGLSAYNISYPGSNIEFHEFLLKTLLEFNTKPRIIVLSLDNPAEFQLDKTLNYRLDKLYPLVKYNYINRELIIRKDKNQLSWLMCLARLNRGNFSIVKKKDNTESPFLPCGSTPFIHQNIKNKFAFQTKESPYSNEREVEDKRKSFLEFKAICERNHIKLIYCFAPNFRTYNPALENRIKLLSAHKVPVFVYDTFNVKYKNKDYFYDESHLNIKGAKLFTSELSHFINQNK